MGKATCSGSATFIAQVDGFTVTSQAIPNPPAPIKRAVLSSPDENRLKVEVEFSELPVSERQGALQKAREFVEELRDFIAYHFLRPIGSPSLKSHSFTEKRVNPDGTKSVSVESTLNVHLSVEGEFAIGLGPKSTQKMLDAYDTKQPDPRRYRAQFRASLGEPPVSQYMALYRFLANLLGASDEANQKQIDSFVECLEPNVSKSHNPKTRRLETVYTKLRNDIGHVRNRLRPQELRARVEAHVYGLAEIVKKAIERKLKTPPNP